VLASSEHTPNPTYTGSWSRRQIQGVLLHKRRRHTPDRRDTPDIMPAGLWRIYP
jgi:hypothetical protein